MKEPQKNMQIKEKCLIKQVKKSWTMLLKDIIVVYLLMDKLEQVKVIQWLDMDQIK